MQVLLLLLLTLLDQIILTIFNFECKISFYFLIWRIVFCWLIVLTSITRTLCVNISNVLRTMYVDDAMLLAKISLIITRFLIFFVLVIIFTSSLNRRRVVRTSFFVFSILCKCFISFLIHNILNLSLFFCFLILNITLLSFFVFFNCRCWLILLYNAIITIAKSTSRVLFVFVTLA